MLTVPAGTLRLPDRLVKMQRSSSLPRVWRSENDLSKNICPATIQLSLPSVECVLIISLTYVLRETPSDRVPTGHTLA